MSNPEVVPLTEEEQAQLEELLQRKQAVDRQQAEANAAAALAPLQPVRDVVEGDAWAGHIDALKEAVAGLADLAMIQDVTRAVTVMEHLGRRVNLRVQQISAEANVAGPAPLPADAD